MIVMSYLPIDKDINDALAFLGYSDLKKFVEDILPKKYLSGFKLDIPSFQDEYELIKFFSDYSRKNKVYPPENVYVGFGVEPVYIPSIVKHIISRGEFLTSYTPYQSEMSQGILQALFEYQSVMAELLELPVVNSSMYDGASAIGEAILMAERINRKGRVLIPREMFPNYKSVVETYLSGPKIEVVEYTSPSIDEDSFFETIEKELRRGVSALYFEFPDIYGYFYRKVGEVETLVHKYNSIFIIGFDVWSLPIIKPPGALGADIAVGEGQPFGLSQGFGGPLLGIFGVAGDMRLIRNMPGRLIGETKTLDGHRAYTLILQTREQHIRREKATSNICTNEALTAIQSLIYLSYIGKKGLYKLSIEMLRLANRLYSELLKIGGFNRLSQMPFHRRFSLYSEMDLNRFLKEMSSRNYIAGYKYGKDVLILHLNTFHTLESINNFLSDVREVV